MFQNLYKHSAQFYNTLRKSTKLYKTLQHSQDSTHVYNNFTTLYTTLETIQHCTRLHNTFTTNYTQLYIMSATCKLIVQELYNILQTIIPHNTQLLQHFPQQNYNIFQKTKFYTTLHNKTQLYTIIQFFRTLYNFTRVYVTIKNATTLYTCLWQIYFFASLQHSTNICTTYKTKHTFAQLYKTFQHSTTLKTTLHKSTIFFYQNSHKRFFVDRQLFFTIVQELDNTLTTVHTCCKTLLNFVYIHNFCRTQHNFYNIHSIVQHIFNTLPNFTKSHTT